VGCWSAGALHGLSIFRVLERRWSVRGAFMDKNCSGLTSRADSSPSPRFNSTRSHVCAAVRAEGDDGWGAGGVLCQRLA